MQSDKKLYACLNQELLPLENTFLHVSDLSIQRGYGVFDYFKCQNGRPVFLEDYIVRFYTSAELMELPVPVSATELKATIFDLIQKNSLSSSGVKIILTGGYSANGFNPGKPNLLLIEQPLSLPTQAQVENGIKVISHDFVREMPAAKTINYTMGIRLIKKINASGAEDVLYHQNGTVSEFPRCNFFIVREDDTVVTPSRDVLHGITRKHVLELAGQMYRAEEGTVTLDDIATAKEAFLTSTTKRILPVVQVDAIVIGNNKPGPVTASLLEGLIRLEEKELERHKAGAFE